VIGVGNEHRHFRFSECNTTGAVSRFVIGVVTRRAQLESVNREIAAAQQEIIQKTLAYEESVRGLLANAGVYSFQPPVVQFIDFNHRPFRGYETTVPSLDRSISHVPEKLCSDVDFEVYARSRY
jgi:hypothetical protein